MLDIIKYSSLEFRKHEGQCIPRGPSFARAKTEKVLLPQCALEFRAPRHSPLRRHAIEQYRVVPEKHYGLEEMSTFGSDFVPSDSWQKVRICSRTWAFYGPWFTGYMGDVSLSINVVGIPEGKPDVNFLYPAALETAIQGFLTAFSGHNVYDKDKLTPYYRGPVNWIPINSLAVPTVQFDVEERITSGYGYRYVVCAVSRDRLLVFRFRFLQNCSGKRADKDAKISPEPMLELINNIISSIRLTPSPELQAEIDKAKAKCAGEYSVPNECQPFKWPADVGKDGLTILDYREGRYKS